MIGRDWIYAANEKARLLFFTLIMRNELCAVIPRDCKNQQAGTADRSIADPDPEAKRAKLKPQTEAKRGKSPNFTGKMK